MQESKNQKVENNLTESFNSWILDARHQPIIGMLEEIRIKVMNMLSKNESDVMTWPTQWSPQAMKLYNEYLRITHKCTVGFNGKYGYDVSEGSNKFIVSLETQKCTCRT